MTIDMLCDRLDRIEAKQDKMTRSMSDMQTSFAARCEREHAQITALGKRIEPLENHGARLTSLFWAIATAVLSSVSVGAVLLFLKLKS